MIRIPVGRIEPAELPEQLLLRRLGVAESRLAERPPLLDEVDDAVVGDRRDERAAELRQRHLQVERRGEKRAGLREEAHALARPPPLELGCEMARDGLRDLELVRGELVRSRIRDRERATQLPRVNERDERERLDALSFEGR